MLFLPHIHAVPEMVMRVRVQGFDCEIPLGDFGPRDEGSVVDVAVPLPGAGGEEGGEEGGVMAGGGFPGRGHHVEGAAGGSGFRDRVAACFVYEGWRVGRGEMGGEREEDGGCYEGAGEGDE